MLFVYLSKGYQPVPEKKSKAWHDICLARLLRAAQAPTSWLWSEYGSRFSIVNIVETNYGLL